MNFAAFLFNNTMDSPFVVPVAGCFMILGIVAVSIWSGTRRREMESQERLAAIARGMVPPPTAGELALTQSRPTWSAMRRRGNVRLGGIILVGVAIGMVLFFTMLSYILRERDVLAGAAVGLIPLGIGIALLIDARIQARELDSTT